MVHQDRRSKLLHLERDRRLCASAAGQAPARVPLCIGEDGGLRLADGQRALDELHAATLAAALSSARELDAVGVEHVAQRRAALHFDAAVQGLQLDSDGVVHSVPILSHSRVGGGRSRLRSAEVVAHGLAYGADDGDGRTTRQRITASQDELVKAARHLLDLDESFTNVETHLLGLRGL